MLMKRRILENCCCVPRACFFQSIHMGMDLISSIVFCIFRLPYHHWFQGTIWGPTNKIEEFEKKGGVKKVYFKRKKEVRL